jgi:hypothetical protein
MYEFGKVKVVPQDYTEAAKWYRKGAQQGDRQAQFNLATMYANGRGVPHDEAESDRWYRKAAEQGDALAQSLVGSAYLFGRGAPKDFVQAYMWLNLAAHGGDHGAAQSRDGLEPFMTAEEIAEAQRLTPRSPCSRAAPLPRSRTPAGRFPSSIGAHAWQDGRGRWGGRSGRWGLRFGGPNREQFLHHDQRQFLQSGAVVLRHGNGRRPHSVSGGLAFIDNTLATQWIASVPLCEEDRAKILSGNAKRLLRM